MRGEARKTIETIQMSMRASLSFLGDPQLAACVLPAEGYGAGHPGVSPGPRHPLPDRPQAGQARAAGPAVCDARGRGARSGGPGRRSAAQWPPGAAPADGPGRGHADLPVPHPGLDGRLTPGQGITIITVAHGEAKLAERWGEHGKQAILDTAGVVVYLPGLRDTATLDTASKLSGDTSYDQQGRRRGEAGQQHPTQHPILTDAMVRAIPRGYGLLIRGDLSPVIAHIPVVWRDWRYLWALVMRRARRRSSRRLSASERLSPPQRPSPPRRPRPPTAIADRLPGKEFDPALPSPAGTSPQYPWTRRPPRERRRCQRRQRKATRPAWHTGTVMTTDRPQASGDPLAEAMAARRARRPAGPAARLRSAMARFAELRAQVQDRSRSGGARRRPAAPRWHVLEGQERAAAVARLASWVGAVYLPVYGHLAGGLGDCWPEHPLALVIIDHLSETWTELFERPRTQRILSLQTEFQARMSPSWPSSSRPRRRCTAARPPGAES